MRPSCSKKRRAHDYPRKEEPAGGIQNAHRGTIDDADDANSYEDDCHNTYLQSAEELEARVIAAR